MAAAGVTEVADGAVYEVEVDLAGADEGRGDGRYVADAAQDGVAQDLEIFGHIRRGLDDSRPARTGSWT